MCVFITCVWHFSAPPPRFNVEMIHERPHEFLYIMMNMIYSMKSSIMRSSLWNRHFLVFIEKSGDLSQTIQQRMADSFLKIIILTILGRGTAMYRKNWWLLYSVSVTNEIFFRENWWLFWWLLHIFGHKGLMTFFKNERFFHDFYIHFTYKRLMTFAFCDEKE